MEGEEKRSSVKGSFSNASIPKRIAIVLAGGIVNILFGLLIYFILCSSTGKYSTTTISGFIHDYTNLENLGFKVGDKITKINDKKIYRKEDIDIALKESKGEKIILKVKRDNNDFEHEVLPVEIKIKSSGIYLNNNGEIVYIIDNSAAEKYGLSINDKVVKINEIDVENSPDKVMDLLNNIKSNSAKFTIIRDNNKLSIDVVLDDVSNYYLGVELKQTNNLFIKMYYALFDTKDFIFSIIDNIKNLFKGNISANQLMGPVGISGVVAETKTIVDYIYIMALISLSLGVTNLLPFPPLDGGKVLILLISGIIHKDINENLEILIQFIGFILLIALSIYVTFNDIVRLF